MSIKHFTRPSFFLMVRVQTGRVRLAIPLPLFVLDQALAALEGLCWLADRIRPGCLQQLQPRAHATHPPSHGRDYSWEAALRLCREFLSELRRYGAWRMVEVEIPEGPESQKVRVHIDFV